ncbi:MAG: hypothetical protein H0V66_00065 [Bdellovibrionales bacterium]|nr:hypothetical protein [Bdellovibrionales bacterium]
MEFKLKYPEAMKDFIRQQLLVSSKDAVATLEYLRTLMPSEEMSSLVNSLNDQDRLKWKATIGTEKAIIDPPRLMTYIKGEMLKAFIASKPLVDPELLELTLKLKVYDVTRFSEMFPNDSGELLNLLNPAFISKVLDKIDISLAEKFLHAALEACHPGNKASTLQSNLKKYLNIAQKNSMASKLIKVLEAIEPEKEKMIYAQMLKVSSTDDLIETAVKSCPLEVVWILPKSALNEILQAYPLQKKARLLVSLENDLKTILIEASSAAGSTARQMIDMELKQIEENPQELRRCQAQANLLTCEFLKFLRLHSQSNEQVRSDIRLACYIWFSQLTQKVATAQAA